MKSLCVALWLLLSSSTVVTADEAASWSDFSLATGPCFRVKVKAENDDDGNAYFYNGAYHAQYTRYASFQLCSSSNNCQSYVTDLEDYVQIMSNYVNDLCEACQNGCRRRLEDAAEDEEEDAWAIDCNSCPANCPNGDDGGANQFMNCAYSHTDGDIAYYAGPQCASDGSIAVGYFYDEDCTYKSEASQKMALLETNTMDCASGYCDDLIGDAVDCSNLQDDDSAKLCRLAEKAGQQKEYAKKHSSGFDAGVVLLVLVLIGSAGFLSYTYYLRHRRGPKIPMADLEEPTGMMA